MQLQVLLPAHNESGNIFPIYKEVTRALDGRGLDYSILFIDDGSTDDTLERIKSLASSDPCVKYIELSRNFGHQNAIKAGLDQSEADILITMDCDLQHPPSLIGEMLLWHSKGYDIVRTRRKPSSHEGLLKKATSRYFYRFMSSISEVRLEEGSADFRLISGHAIQTLKSFGEYDLFYRGLIKWIGFRQVSIEYEPAPRLSGETKYSYRKMFSFGLNGFTSFSTKPLYISAYIGVVFAFLSLLYIPYAVWAWMKGNTVSGWTSLIMTVVFFGGLQLMILGIIGIYIAKVFNQSRNRPHYIVKTSNL